MMADLFYAAVLIAALDSNSFRVREAAEARLEGMGYLAIPSLELTRGRSPEQSLRIERTKKRICDGAICRITHRFQSLPWIDSLPDDWPGRAEVINHYMYMAACCPILQKGTYAHYRVATWHLAVSQLATHGEAATMRLLKRMESRCRNWDGRYPPPKEQLAHE